MEDDGGYAGRVLAEHDRLKQVAAGRLVPTLVPQSVPVKAAQNVKPAIEVVASLSNS